MNFLFIFLSINFSLVHASLEGRYELISGSDEVCPSGNIVVRNDVKNKERVLFFGSAHSWSLKMEDKASIIEVVEGGCRYTTNYEKSKNALVVETIRSSCPKLEENSVINEKLILGKDRLTYTYTSTVPKKNTKCLYKKSGK